MNDVSSPISSMIYKTFSKKVWDLHEIRELDFLMFKSDFCITVSGKKNFCAYRYPQRLAKRIATCTDIHIFVRLPGNQIGQLYVIHFKFQ